MGCNSFKRISGIALCLSICLSQNSIGQYNPTLRPYERLFLETVLRDTVGRALCHLQRQFLFNMEDRSFSRLVLVKKGKCNFLVGHASGKVYVARATPDGPTLVRIDSSRQTGDNFNMLPIFRKDTLYQFGGYGYWRTRDFFTRYNPSKSDWEFVASKNAIPAEHTMYQYDRDGDALYLVGGTLMDTRHNDASPTSDSVYRYAFGERSWRSIGLLRPEHIQQVKIRFQSQNPYFVYTEFGVLQLYDSPSLFDFKGNRVLRPGRALFDRLMHFLNRMHSAQIPNSVLFHMNDTLHGIVAKGDGAEHISVGLTAEEFDEATAVPLYDPVEQPSGSGWAWMASIAGIASVAFLTHRYRRNGKQAPAGAKEPTGGTETERQKSTTESMPLEAAPSSATLSVPEDRSKRFLASLTPAEREFVSRLLQLSLQGDSMDIETFNKIIGVALKEEGVRKTRRSLTVSNVNNAFSLTMQVKGELVVRERDPLDRRSYRYLVSEEHLHTLQRVFGMDVDSMDG